MRRGHGAIGSKQSCRGPIADTCRYRRGSSTRGARVKQSRRTRASAAVDTAIQASESDTRSAAVNWRRPRFSEAIPRPATGRRAALLGRGDADAHEADEAERSDAGRGGKSGMSQRGGDGECSSGVGSQRHRYDHRSNWGMAPTTRTRMQSMRSRDLARRPG